MWQFNGNQRPSFASEPQPGQESVWDYPRPPAVVPDDRDIEVRLGQVVLAKTSAAIRILETASPPTFYLPPGDVDWAYLVASSGSSFREWKGAATYWSVQVGDLLVKNAGWGYTRPRDRFRQISGYISFYPSRLECFVDGERVRPQPGGFYGGWITDEIIGPVKGEPGTGQW